MHSINYLCTTCRMLAPLKWVSTLKCVPSVVFGAIREQKVCKWEYETSFDHTRCLFDYIKYYNRLSSRTWLWYHSWIIISSKYTIFNRQKNTKENGLYAKNRNNWRVVFFNHHNNRLRVVISDFTMSKSMNTSECNNASQECLLDVIKPVFRAKKCVSWHAEV